ncbi:MAG: HpaII family restriction endonuclease [Candidatus Gastranaerophilaceae bacterium]
MTPAKPLTKAFADGYIIAGEDEEIFCYHIYNHKEFQEYLAAAIRRQVEGARNAATGTVRQRFGGDSGAGRRSSGGGSGVGLRSGRMVDSGTKKAAHRERPRFVGIIFRTVFTPPSLCACLEIR